MTKKINDYKQPKTKLNRNLNSLIKNNPFFFKKKEYSKFLNIKNMKYKFKLSKERLT